MKYSELWLRKWINLSIDHDKLINQLTMIGFHVEESRPVIPNKFYGVVIGEIIDFNKHPKLNDAWIIKINNGSKKLINTVYVKKINCKKNLKIVIANAGALLPNGQIVNPIIIQGEKSEGILCTFSTLGLNFFNKENIIELPPEAPIGYNFYDYLDLHDNILHVDIPPNRGDCLSVIGLSREISAINQSRLKKLKIHPIKPTITDTIPIFIEEPADCPLFLGKILKNITTTLPTPLKIKEKLRRCDIPSINIVMDIINYVILELGQPIDIFDYKKINYDKIYVRFSKPGEKLKLLDNNTDIQLFKNTLLISNNNNPIAIAGIIIGNQSLVSDETNDIFLHTAYFNPLTIKKQAKLYNLRTSSSIRYERGVDPKISKLALNYATSLLLKYCHGYAGPTISVINHNYLPKNKIIRLRHIQLSKTLGFHIENERVINILRSLGFQVKNAHNYWKVSIPTWRFDINIEENLISEIIRIYGYDKIPQIPIKTSLITQFYRNKVISLSRFKTALIDRGYHEIITYSFVDPKIQQLLYPQYTPLTVINPMSADMSVMRLSLWTGLLTTTLYNQNRQQKHFQLFESGTCFIPDSIAQNNQVSQQMMLSGIRFGLKKNKHWSLEESLIDFYDIKGDVEFLFSIFNKNKEDNIIFKNCKHSALHPGQSSGIYINNILMGYIGKIHPIIQTKLRLNENIFLFELFWNSISKFKLPKIKNISKFPKNYRDISLIIPLHISAESIINECKNKNIQQLIEIELIDVYTGSNIEIGYKSITIKLTLQSQTHTLQEQEIANILNIYTKALKKRFRAILR